MDQIQAPMPCHNVHQIETSTLSVENENGFFPNPY